MENKDLDLKQDSFENDTIWSLMGRLRGIGRRDVRVMEIYRELNSRLEDINDPRYELQTRKV